MGAKYSQLLKQINGEAPCPERMDLHGESMPDLQLLNQQGGKLNEDQIRTVLRDLVANNAILSLDLSGNPIIGRNPEYIATLIQQNETIIDLNIEGCDIDDAGMEQICQHLADNKTLLRLNLFGNKFTNPGVKCLAEALQCNTTLLRLWLSTDDIDPTLRKRTFKLVEDNQDELKKAAKRSIVESVPVQVVDDVLQKLDGEQAKFYRANLTADQVMAILHNMEHNSTVKVLDLSYNAAVGDCVESVSEMLRKSKNITKLILAGCKIDDNSMELMYEALRSTHSLKELHLNFNKGITNVSGEQLMTILRGDGQLVGFSLGGTSIDKELRDKIHELSRLKKESSSTKPTCRFENRNMSVDQCIMILNTMIKNKYVKKLIFTGNPNVSKCIEGLSNMIRKNDVLTELNLANCDIDDASMKSICEALTSNQTMTRISLNMNMAITDVGGEYLLQVLKKTKLIGVELSDTGIGVGAQQQIQQLVEASRVVGGKSVDRFLQQSIAHLSDTGYTVETSKQLLRLMSSNKSVKKLDLSRNHNVVAFAAELSEMLTSNDSITDLYMRYCILDDHSMNLLMEALTVNHTLLVLNISNTDIDGGKMDYIANMLRTNQSLTQLDMRKCSIADDSVRVLCDALRENCTLEKLWLNFNKSISDVGGQYLLDMMESNSTIVHLSIDLGIKDIKLKNKISQIVRRNGRGVATEKAVQKDKEKAAESSSRIPTVASEHVQVAEWLNTAARTEKHSKQFLNEEMLWDDLDDLGDDDLTAIGVDSHTVRKRILKAIKNRPKDQPTSPAATPHNQTFLNEHFDVESTMKGGQHQLVAATMFSNNRTVVLKIYDDKAEFEKEKKMLFDLRSSHVVDLVGSHSYPDIDRHVLALERGVETLHDKLEKGRIDPLFVRPFIKQAVQCVDFIHQKDIIHSDIKPKNFLFLDAYRIVLIDLDGACAVYRDTLPCDVTGSYCAPERMTTKDVKATPSADIWSLGVMIYEMLTGKRFGVGYTEDELREVLTDDSLNYFDMSLIDSKAARRMLEPMLDLDPKKRGSAAEALKHSYLSGVADTEMESMRKDVKVVRAGVGELVGRE